MMKRRGFILNSVVLILLIPLLLLLATYEDVSSQILQAQSERVQVERSFSSTAYFDVDFQRALEIAGKRAILAVVDYTAVTGLFINSPVNETIRELILFGNSSQISIYENLPKIIGNQSLVRWLSLMREKLRTQGFYLLPENDTKIINNTEIIVAPLDSFRVIIKAKIYDITITDASGKVVYTGSIPKTTNYTYAIIDIRELEDPLFPPLTRGKYHRSIRACLYPFPELIERPIIALDGEGESDRRYITGFYDQDIFYNSTHIWSGNAYMTNITFGNVRVSPIYYLNEWDRGVLLFRDIMSSGGINWCNFYYEGRFNVTLQNTGSKDLVDVPVKIEVSKSDLPIDPRIRIYDENCSLVNFWVEKWKKSGNTVDIIIWVRTSIPAGSIKTLSIYFDDSAPINQGDPNLVFEFYEDFEDGVLDGWEFSGSNWTATTDEKYSGSYSAKSEGSNSCMYRNITISGTSELSFWWKLENGAQGALSFYLNGDQNGTTTSTSWENKIYQLSSGSYEIKWCFNSSKSNPKNGYVDLITIRKVGGSGVSINSSEIEFRPEYPLHSSNATAYNLQPFIECILDQRYFGTYEGWSFFERLEGTSINHEAYFNLSKQMQDELGVAENGRYYPIGLVSFMIADSDWDAKLVNLLNQLGISVSDQTSTDYYFLQYYFKNGDKVSGNIVWGISDYIDSFYMDNETAIAIFGEQGACDLLEGYTCS